MINVLRAQMVRAERQWRQEGRNSKNIKEMQEIMGFKKDINKYYFYRLVTRQYISEERTGDLEDMPIGTS